MSNASKQHLRDEQTGKHIHKFVKVKDDRVTLWRCADGTCSFTLYKKQELMLIGRASYCWECGNTFQMSEASLTEDLPLCPSCRVTDDNQAIAELLDLEEKELNKEI